MRKRLLWFTLSVLLICLSSSCGTKRKPVNSANWKDFWEKISETEEETSDAEELDTEEFLPEETEAVDFYKYVKERLIPEDGLFQTPQQGDMTSFSDEWLQPEGILTAAVDDYDGDGDEELFVAKVQKAEKSSGVCYELNVEMYEAMGEDIVLTASMPATPYYVNDDRENIRDPLSLTKNNCMDTFWGVSLVEVGEAKYFVFESQFRTAAFANGEVQDYWALAYDRSEWQYVFSFAQVGIGSSDLKYQKSEFEEGKLADTCLAYVEEPGKGVYDTYDEAIRSTFETYGMFLDEHRTAEFFYEDTSRLSNDNQMEALLRMTNTLIKGDPGNLPFTFETKLNEDYGLRDYLDMNSADDPDETEETAGTDMDAADIFKQLPQSFVFTGGAGAWQTQIDLNSDGTFTGQYHDSDSGVNPTERICNFEGKFSSPEQVNEYIYSMKLEYLNTEETPGKEYYENNVRYVYTDPYGFEDADEFRIYLPGCPLEETTEEFISWSFINPEIRETIPSGVYGIYNVGGQKGFIGTKDNLWHKTYKYGYGAYKSELWPRYDSKSQLVFWPESGASLLSLEFDWTDDDQTEFIASDSRGTGDYEITLDFSEDYSSVFISVKSLSGYDLTPWGGSMDGALAAEYYHLQQ